MKRSRDDLSGSSQLLMPLTLDSEHYDPASGDSGTEGKYRYPVDVTILKHITSVFTANGADWLDDRQGITFRLIAQHKDFASVIFNIIKLYPHEQAAMASSIMDMVILYERWVKYYVQCGILKLVTWTLESTTLNVLLH